MGADSAADPGVVGRPETGTPHNPGVESSAEVEIREVAWANPLAVELRREFYERTNLRLYPEWFGQFEPYAAWSADDAATGHSVLVTYIALKGGVPVGHAALRTPDDGAPASAGELAKVYVRDQARRLGVARLLVSTVENAARARGLSAVVLGTGPLQLDAAAAYINLGYAPMEPYPPYDSYGDALCFAKPLVPVQ